jgi:hypothetical protein
MARVWTSVCALLCFCVGSVDGKLLGAFDKDSENAVALKGARKILGVNRMTRCRGIKKAYAKLTADLLAVPKESIDVEQVMSTIKVTELLHSQCVLVLLC